MKRELAIFFRTLKKRVPKAFDKVLLSQLGSICSKSLLTSEQSVKSVQI